MKFKITLLTFFMALSMSAQTWTNVGSTSFTGASVGFQSMTLDNNDVPYVAYEDSQNSNKIHF